MLDLNIIVACDLKNGIGINNTLPWHIKSDLMHFKRITCSTQSPSKKNAIIMGRKTWDSLPNSVRPLPNRLNCILSRSPQIETHKDSIVSNNFDQLIETLQRPPYQNKIENIFVIGGESLYTLALKHPLCKKIYLTQIETQFTCDVFFPSIPKTFKKISESPTEVENDISFKYIVYEKP